MTGHRNSCKTCKKAAASSLPCMEMSVPVVDGVLYQDKDHEENRTPGFGSRTVDAMSEPVTPGAAAVDLALGRTEPTPGFRKTAEIRKAATQGSSFTAVAQQTTQEIDAAEKGKAAASSDNSSCGDENGPKGAAGCSDQSVSEAKVAASITAADPDPSGIDIKSIDGGPVVVKEFPISKEKSNDKKVQDLIVVVKNFFHGNVNLKKMLSSDDGLLSVLKSVHSEFSSDSGQKKPTSPVESPSSSSSPGPKGSIGRRIFESVVDNKDDRKYEKDCAPADLFYQPKNGSVVNASKLPKAVTKEGKLFEERTNFRDEKEFVLDLFKYMVEVSFVEGMAKMFSGSRREFTGEEYADGVAALLTKDVSKGEVTVEYNNLDGSKEVLLLKGSYNVADVIGYYLHGKEKSGSVPLS